MSSRVVLARPLRTGSPGAQQVHAYRVPADGTPWRAPCGSRLSPGEAEIVPQYTGVPCGRCIIGAATAADAPPLSRAELEGESPDRLDGASAMSRAEAAGFALSWRARIVHLVPAGAPTTTLDGGTLALGHCGALGWGPIPGKPDPWPTCPDCTARTN